MPRVVAPSVRTMSRLTLPAVIVIAALAAGPGAAEARPVKGWEAYAGLTLEASLAGVFYINFSDVADHVGDGVRIPLGIVGMFALPVGAGFAAHRLDLDPRPALAIHGAAWYGLDGFMLGSLIDGRDQAWGLRVGKTAWTLAAIGAVGGAIVGARHVDNDDEATMWFAGPTAGFAAGGLVLGTVLVFAGGLDGDDAPGQFVTGATIGLTVGLGAATALAIRGMGDASPGRRKQVARLLRYAPRVAAGPHGAVLAVGGTF